MRNAVSIFFLQHLILTTVLFVTLLFPFNQTSSSASEQKITIFNQEQSDPPWKQRWDKARELSQQREFASAIEQYRKVVEEKPHIEEVRWELARTYIAARSYPEALMLIEELVEAAPNQTDYLVSGGEVALALGKADQAGQFFGRALALEPDGDRSVKALTGMIDSLTARDKDDLAIPLMEQLYLLGKRSQNLLTELARFYDFSGKPLRSAYFYQELLTKFSVQSEMMLEAAAVFDKSERYAEAAELRENALIIDPLQFEARVKLADYYQGRGEDAKALPHLLELLEQGYRRDRILLEVAGIYYHSLNRSDRALYYYEQYRTEYPNGIDVSADISALQLLVAMDLMAIVENDGVSMLWRDLGLVTDDRTSIFLAIADKLEEKGRSKKRELLEVLKVINEHNPGDLSIVKRIAHLYLQNKDYVDCLTFLDESDASISDQAALLLLRMRCEASAGQELNELQSYISYLQIRPDDFQIRLQGLELAGALGLVDEIRDLYANRADNTVSPTGAVEEAFLHGLLLSGLSSEAHQFLKMITAKGVSPRIELRSYQELADLYLTQNRLFKAEQLLRKAVFRYPSSPEAYLALVEHFIDRKDVSNAKRWLERLGSDRYELTEQTPAEKSELFYLQLRLDDLSGRKGGLQRALDYLDSRLDDGHTNAADVEVVLYAARSLLRNNRVDECNELLKNFRPRFEDEERIDSLQLICSHIQNNNKNIDSFLIEELSVSDGFGVVDQLLELERFEEAHQLSTELAARLPASTRGAVLLAQTGFLTSRFQEAGRKYLELAQTYPEENWFEEQLLRGQIFMGEPESIFTTFSVAADETGRKNRIISHLDSMNYPQAKLMWARTLWAEDRWEDALDVYGLLDTELKREMDQLISVIQNQPELLSGVSQGTPEKDIVETIMSTEFFAENPSDKINEISVDYYDTYRWSSIVEKEVAAKSALKGREFYQAEIEYQELFEEDRAMVEENYPDLATVYGRLGRLKEESALIETIQERSIFYPGLSEVSEKSIRRQRPHLSIDGGYRQEEGRDGFKDITEKYAGLSIQIKPTLYQEIGLSAGRSEYGNNSASTLEKSNRLGSNYAIELSDNFQGEFFLGFEDFDTDGKSFLLYDATLFATLEQKVEFYATIKQNPVDDTITALQEGLYRRDKEFGITLDYLFGMFFGVDLGFYDYNDDNEGQKYHLWSSYRWFGERSSFDFSYRYLKLQNEIANTTLSGSAAEDMQSRPPYWSPADYWQHLVSAEYKLELWPTGRLQSGTSWLSARYGLGYEKNDNLVQELEANIFLEIGRPFLVKGTFSTVISDDYDSFEGYISLAYRW